MLSRMGRRFLVCSIVLMLALPSLIIAQTAPRDVEVRIMTFNIWIGGSVVDFNQVIEVIRAGRADIVGLQEAQGNTALIAERLGWHYSESLHVVSRFPLIEVPEGDWRYVYAQIAPGQVVVVANVHLPSDPYGPYEVRDGMALDDVLALETETRLAPMQESLTAFAPLIESGIPLLLTGDFNTPSHLDWTEAGITADSARLYPVAYPVTIAIEEAGFTDTYRAAHPIVAERPGNTWTYGYPYPRLRENEMIDRIDMIHAANIDAIVSSEIVGPGGSPDADIAVDPYPSDHRAVVSTVLLTPVEPGLFAVAERRAVTQGEPLVVRYHAPEGEATDRIAVLPIDGTFAEALMWLPPQEAEFFGAVTFGTGTLPPGRYETAVVDGSNELLTRAMFWILPRSAQPGVDVESTLAQGEEIEVTWENAPTNRYDWIGIYAAGDPDVYNGYYAFAYTQATSSGDYTFNADDLGEEMLPSGDYVVRLMRDDGYEVLAESPFTVGE